MGKMIRSSKVLVCLLLLLVLLTPSALADSASAVPLAANLRQEGFAVEWQGNGLIQLQVDDLTIQCQSGSTQLVANGRSYSMSQPIYIVSGVSYIYEDGLSLIDNIVLYNRAVVDAIIAEQDEILPLKKITGTDEVLLCTWHRYPTSYPDNAVVTTQYGEVWVFTAEEINSFMQANSDEEDMVLRLEQLIGLPPQKGNTHFSFLWVDPADLFRPARDNEITDTTVGLTFPASASAEYIAWFNGNSIYSYQQHYYPWTGLGYTYDWADNGTEYGLSEFVIKANCEIRVEKTYSNEEFFALFAN